MGLPKKLTDQQMKFAYELVTNFDINQAVVVFSHATALFE